MPGPRSFALMAPVKFPWRATVNSVEHVGSEDSYQLSMELSRAGLICGPSSGLNLKGMSFVFLFRRLKLTIQGLYQFLERRIETRTLGELFDAKGNIHCVFICCDLPYQYIDDYFNKLGPESLPAVHNKVRYDLNRLLKKPPFVSVLLSGRGTYLQIHGNYSQLFRV